MTTVSVVMEPIERADVDAILAGVFDANVKLDEVLRYLYDDDGEEEEDSA